jgi:uncharacterized protein YbjQ (UPF0145 family)
MFGWGKTIIGGVVGADIGVLSRVCLKARNSLMDRMEGIAQKIGRNFASR